MNWERPFEFKTVCDMVVHLSGLTGRKPFVWEVRITTNCIKFLLGFDLTDENKLKKLFSAHNNVQFSKPQNRRSKIVIASRIKIHQQHFSLKLDNIENMIRSFLAIHSTLKKMKKSRSN